MWHPAAGSWRGSPRGRAMRRIRSAPPHAYTQQRRTILNAAGTTQISGQGSGTVTVGPAGLGTRWYPTQANVSTTTGANDASTVALYRGAVAAANLLGGSSYAGGQDTIGLNIHPLEPGDFLIAVWSGGHPGDTATLVVYGEQDYQDIN